MKAPRRPKILPEHRKTIENFWLLMRSELADLDGKLFVRFAGVQSSEQLGLLEAYCLARFDTGAQYLRPFTASDHPTALNTVEKLLKVGENKALKFLREVLSSVPKRVLQDSESRVALKLKSRTLSYLAEARLKQHDRVSRATSKNRTVTSGTIKRRQH